MTDAPNIVMFPESFIALRKELVAHHFMTIWPKVAHAMIYDKVVFLEEMNNWLQVRVPFDCDLDTMAKTYLDGARATRGISPLHTTSEKYPCLTH